MAPDPGPRTQAQDPGPGPRTQAQGHKRQKGPNKKNEQDPKLILKKCSVSLDVHVVMCSLCQRKCVCVCVCVFSRKCVVYCIVCVSVCTSVCVCVGRLCNVLW